MLRLRLQIASKGARYYGPIGQIVPRRYDVEKWKRAQACVTRHSAASSNSAFAFDKMPAPSDAPALADAAPDVIWADETDSPTKSR